jgi:hypothetical protein
MSRLGERRQHWASDPSSTDLLLGHSTVMTFEGFSLQAYSADHAKALKTLVNPDWIEPSTS